MNTEPASGRGTVALVGLTSPDLECVRDAVTLAGARVCVDPARASLVLAAPQAPVPDCLPCVRVGDEGQVSPRDTALLVSLIAEASRRALRPGAVWVVAGIAGGVGVTRVVRLLAHAMGRTRAAWKRCPRWMGKEPGSESGSGLVVVDASGAVPGFARACDHSAPGVRWADLDALEDSYLPALRDQLPLIGGVHAIVGDGRGGAHADDPRVVAACRSLDAPLLVDVGRWDARAAQCALAIGADVAVLVTHGDLEGAAAMAAVLTLSPPPCPALTLVTRGRRRSPGLRECAPTPILSLPTRSGRDLRALRRALASTQAPPDGSRGPDTIGPGQLKASRA